LPTIGQRSLSIGTKVWILVVGVSQTLSTTSHRFLSIRPGYSC